MGNFYTDVIRKDPRFNSTHTINDMALLEPGTRASAEAIIAEAKAMGHDLRVGETYRSQARQHMLYQQGATQLNKVGCHGYGVAVDLQLFVDGEYQTDGNKYTFLVDLCKKHKMVSGVDWGTPNQHHSFRDYDHIQKVPVSRQNQLFSGKWYPSPDYDPWDEL